jgi:predicted nucleotide-binding protein (sugar kinase/HSP70/actin superfamily)
MINKIKELVEEANILPIDYDASASKVNQENRIKLMLATAR